MSELLFECYRVPQVCYGVDSMFSLYNNHPNPGKWQRYSGTCKIVMPLTNSSKFYSPKFILCNWMVLQYILGPLLSHLYTHLCTSYLLLSSYTVSINLFPLLATASSLIVSCGYHTTHVQPVLDGCLHARYTRRINMGGLQIDSFMQRLLQLKYPGHLAALTLSRAEVSYIDMYDVRCDPIKIEIKMDWVNQQLKFEIQIVFI